jgi:23S rRNA pseudouridine1911/1915/1917 synthase
MSDPPEQLDTVVAAATDDAAETEEAELRRFRWRVAKNLTRRIDQYLVDRVGYLSRNGVQQLIEDGFVKVNNRPTKSSYRPRENDVIEMTAPPEPISELVPEPIPLDIVFEDEHFLALNKQANLMVHPARGVWTGTLVNGLVHYGKKWSAVGGDWRPGILHRLDRNTTGIMLVAKRDEAHWRMARQFENRTIQKTYLAIAHGVPELRADIIDLPIGRDRYVREKQAVRKEANGGKSAVTKYEVHEVIAPSRAFTPGSAPDKYSLIELQPKTGRTHQLRVHLSAIGHPIVGDAMYGGQPIVMDAFRFERQALHAYKITFVHPTTLQTMTLEAPLPPDMTRLLELLRT